METTFTQGQDYNEYEGEDGQTGLPLAHEAFMRIRKSPGPDVQNGTQGGLRAAMHSRHPASRVL